jgi:hypothetical protein
LESKIKTKNINYKKIYKGFRNRDAFKLLLLDNKYPSDDDDSPYKCAFGFAADLGIGML